MNHCKLPKSPTLPKIVGIEKLTRTATSVLRFNLDCLAISAILAILCASMSSW
jgi:hypothetical protein